MVLRPQPFNAQYEWFNTTDNLQIVDPNISVFNTYKGGVYQQVTASVKYILSSDVKWFDP